MDANSSWKSTLKYFKDYLSKNKSAEEGDRKIDFHGNIPEEKINPLSAVQQHLQPMPATPTTQTFPETSFPYLNYASCEYKKAGLETLKDTTVPFLYVDADTHVNALDFDQAVKLYHVLLANQESLAVSTEKNHDNNTLNRKIPRLHKKLCLLIKVNQLHSCVEKKDYPNLKRLLNDAASLYNELLKEADANEKQFLQSIESYHQLYSQLVMQNL